MTNLRPGYYYARLLIHGKPTSVYLRLPVVGSSKDLIIQNLYGYDTPDEYNLLDPSQSFDTPVKLKREKDYGLATNAYTAYLYTTKPGETSVRRVHLISLTDPMVSYLVPLMPDGPAQFRLPSTIHADRYQFIFEILTAANIVLTSEPLERDVVIE